MNAVHHPDPDFAAEAVLACVEGRATERQQRSVAAQLALQRNAKNELLAVVRDFLEFMVLAELDDDEPHVVAAREVIAKTTGIAS